jgi:pectate lyase
VFHDFGDIAKTQLNDPDDAIDVIASHDVWIDHNDLSMAGDKLVAIARGSTGVTISWNHFHDQVDTLQLGNQTNAAIDVDMAVTIHHNFFDHTAYRNPVVSYGKAHSFDNYIVGWQWYGVRSERIAQMYLEDNVFEAGTNLAATKTKPGGDGCNDSGTICDDRPGYLRSVGNLAKNGAKIIESQPELVFRPSDYYSYTAEPAGDALVASLVTQAGWQAPVAPPSPPPHVIPVPALKSALPGGQVQDGGVRTWQTTPPRWLIF